MNRFPPSRLRRSWVWVVALENDLFFFTQRVIVHCPYSYNRDKVRALSLTSPAATLHSTTAP